MATWMEQIRWIDSIRRPNGWWPSTSRNSVDGEVRWHWHPMSLVRMHQTWGPRRAIGPLNPRYVLRSLQSIYSSLFRTAPNGVDPRHVQAAECFGILQMDGRCFDHAKRTPDNYLKRKRRCQGMSQEGRDSDHPPGVPDGFPSSTALRRCAGTVRSVERRQRIQRGRESER